MRWQWHFGLGRELGYAFWALTFFEAAIGAYAPIWPLWIEDRGASIAIVGIVLASAGIFRPLVLAPGTALIDRFNTRNLLLACRGLSVLGLVIAALAQTWEILLVTVLFNTIGELVFPTIHAYIADHAGENAVHAFNMTITIGPAGGLILTPLLSGLVIGVGGMPAAFILSAVLTLAGMAFVSRMQFESHRVAAEGEQRTTYRAAVLHQGIRSLVILHGCTILSLSIGVALISNFLEVERGLSPSTIAMLSSGAAVGTVAFGLFSARFRPLRHTPVLGAAAAAALTALGFLLFGTQAALPLIGIAYVLRGGLFSAWALFLAALGKVAPGHLRSRAFAVMEITGGSAMSFGPIIAARLWDIDPAAPLFVAAALGLTMAGIGVIASRRPSINPPSTMAPA